MSPDKWEELFAYVLGALYSGMIVVFIIMLVQSW